jgi:hypothetical protein
MHAGGWVKPQTGTSSCADHSFIGLDEPRLVGAVVAVRGRTVATASAKPGMGDAVLRAGDHWISRTTCWPWPCLAMPSMRGDALPTRRAGVGQEAGSRSGGLLRGGWGLNSLDATTLDIGPTPEPTNRPSAGVAAAARTAPPSPRCASWAVRERHGRRRQFRVGAAHDREEAPGGEVNAVAGARNVLHRRPWALCPSAVAAGPG